MKHQSVATALVTVTVTVTAGTIWLWAANNGAFKGDAVFTLAGVTAFAGLGWLLTLRRPENPVSWLLALTGLSLAVNAGAWELLLWSLRVAAPTAHLAEFLSGFAFFTAVTVLGALVPLRFPTGNPLTPRWRWVEQTVLLGLAMVGVVSAIAVADLPQSQLGTGVPLGSRRPLLTALGMGGSLLILTGALVALASLGLRWHRSVAVERQQLRWLALPMAPLGIGIAVELTLQGPIALALLAVGLLTIPVGIGIAILRYRLYEIDRIVSRTVTYTLVTAALVALYALITVVPTIVFDLQSDLLVAAATLAAAAAFGPLRRTVQAHVDRRFNRSRYDATRVADRFATRLRDEVDIDDLTADLRQVVAATVQPAHLTVWLTQPVGSGRGSA